MAHIPTETPSEVAWTLTPDPTAVHLAARVPEEYLQLQGSDSGPDDRPRAPRAEAGSHAQETRLGIQPRVRHTPLLRIHRTRWPCTEPQGLPPATKGVGSLEQGVFIHRQEGVSG